jgi:hypothetical protein
MNETNKQTNIGGYQNGSSSEVVRDINIDTAGARINLGAVVFSSYRKSSKCWKACQDRIFGSSSTSGSLLL